jgi:hypothetical protein
LSEKKETLDVLDDIFTVNIKGGTGPHVRLMRALERSNTLIASPDPAIYEASVRAILSELPIDIKARVMERENEFNTEQTRYQYQYNCKVPMGTIENPLVEWFGNDKWDFLKDNIAFSDAIEGIDYEVISPKTITAIQTDYEKLAEICREQLEIGGLSWRTDQRLVDGGKPIKEKTLPAGIGNTVEKILVETLLELRKTYPTLSFQELVESAKDKNPPTPMLDYQEESE